MFTCDGNQGCTNKVDVGGSNPSIVICADCNNGVATWNCVDVGNHSCDCIHCDFQVDDEYIANLKSHQVPDERDYLLEMIQKGTPWTNGTEK